MKIVILDGYTANPGDLSWDHFHALGEVTIYDRTAPEDTLNRCAGAEIIVVNKHLITAELIRQLPQLRCICVTATGFNNVDTTAARAANIPVCNVVGYSTPAVVQHVFALVFTLTNKCQLHHDSVQAGDWSRSLDFSYQLAPIKELSGLTMGIYGFGRIGQGVAAVAQAFGMSILTTHKHPERDARPGVRFVDLETLFSESDIISLHAPLSSSNREIVNASLLQRMRPTAYLINTGRGPLINEQDLAEALKRGLLAGAGLDVLSEEPPSADNPLIDAPNCIITPHNAWGSRDARARLLADTVENIQGFQNDQPRNVVN